MENRRVSVFYDEFETQLKSHNTYREAYEATEEKFKEAFGFQNYSGYDSFKSARNRKLRSRRK